MDDILFGLLHTSIILLAIVLVYLIKTANKRQIHIIFIINSALILLLSLSYLFEAYHRNHYGKTLVFLVYIWYFSLLCIPVSFLFMGIIFIKTNIKMTLIHYSLFLAPLISLILITTKHTHTLLYDNFSLISSMSVYGKYNVVYSLSSYVYILVGVGCMIYYSVKNARFFSKQSLLIFIGTFIPLAVHALMRFRLIDLPAYVNAILFSFAMIFYTFAVFYFDFLSTSPIALQIVVDRISDSFLVVNEEYQIIDFNSPIIDTFSGMVKISRKKDIYDLFSGTSLLSEDNNLVDMIISARISETSISYKKHVKNGEFNKHFKIEITPIVSNKNCFGTIVLFKDITENVKYIDTIEEKHAIMMEQERLASLGQLIGGIAHNLKTPIMSIAGATEGLRDLVNEYSEAIGDESVSNEDHREIVGEMMSWIDKIKPYCAYMSDVIDAVKGQATTFNASCMLSFTVGELVKRIEILLKYELIRYNCSLRISSGINLNTELFGDINSLIQVFDNIIINAIHAYEKKSGIIDYAIEEKGDSILFIIRDYAKGIPDGIKSKLLKEMITTKGKDGTGLGLYMSYATIKGHFGGKMWFESVEGNGASFFIQIPLSKQILN